MSMFDRPATTAPNAPAAPARSKYGGIKAGDTRDPMLGLGTYRVKVVSCAEGYNPGKRRESYKATLLVVAAAPGSETPVGSTVTMVSFQTPAGLGELKRFAMHAAGFGPTLDQRAAGSDVKATLLAAEAAFDSLDEKFGYQGAVIEASAGKANGAPSLAGRLVDVIVSKGKDVPNPQTGASTGDYFRNYVWGIVPDAEQR